MTNQSLRARKRRLSGIPQCYYTNKNYKNDDIFNIHAEITSYPVIDGLIGVAVLQIEGIHHHSLSQLETISDPEVRMTQLGLN